ncbi:MAG: hypothetical protein B7Z02_14990 [Rhodobacterales bacterium 32-67-9]|nr:MAG: hypothetical protein B7Z02_14990 [Rhodobacterales bacterium 32-67-9]
MPDDAKTVIGSLDETFRAEAQAIRRGDFSAIGTLAERKATLVDRLMGLPRGEVGSALARIRARASENQHLLTASLQGVRAARARIDAIRQAGIRLDTYDSSGRARTVSFGGGAIEKRA